MPAVSSMFSFGKRTVCAGFTGSCGDVARTEERDEWVDRHSHLGINLGINMNPGCM
jgi:hypothetical protein